jgi:hypothetical protein
MRIFLLTGNPVFPFMTSVFGDNLWVMSHSRLPADFGYPGWLPRCAATIMRWLGARLTIMWSVVVRRQRFGDLPPVSPAYLLPLPILCITPFWEPQTAALVATVTFWLESFLLLSLPPSSHYLVAILPVWSYLVAYGCSVAIKMATRCRPRRQRRVLTGLCFLFFLPGWFYAGYRMVKLGGIPTTQVERRAYLSTQLPGLSCGRVSQPFVW